jgi:hypothetical protein
MNNSRRQWGLSEEGMKQVDTLWTHYQRSLSDKTGIPSDAIRLNLDNISPDPKRPGYFTVPVNVWDIWSTNPLEVQPFSFPSSSVELKKAVEDMNKSKVVPLTPEQQKALDKFESNTKFYLHGNI